MTDLQAKSKADFIEAWQSHIHELINLAWGLNEADYNRLKATMATLEALTVKRANIINWDNK